MKRNLLKCFIVMAITAILIISCNVNSGTTEATVRVIGTYEEDTSSIARGPSQSFQSGKLLVDNKDISNELKPIAQNATGNNVELEATVTVPATKIKLESKPKEGFVFDEWEVDKDKVRSDFKAGKLSFKDIRNIELDDRLEENESIEVEAKYIQYYIATFDRGFYVDLTDTAEAGTGTKDKPYNLSQLPAELQKWNEDEITIKIKGSTTKVLDLSSINYINRNLEEIKVIGYEKEAKIDSIKLPTATTRDKDEEELEIELKNLYIENFDANEFPLITEESEIEYENITVGKLSNPNGRVFANMRIEKIDDVDEEPKSPAIFVNCIVPYKDGYAYFHSIITEAETIDKNTYKENDFINNILIKTTGNSGEKLGENIIIATQNKDITFEIGKGLPAISTTIAIPEEDIENLVKDFGEYIEDYIEEDVYGKERPEANDDRTNRKVLVSYGPVEYLNSIEYDD